jgi:hypothetical protein
MLYHNCPIAKEWLATPVGQRESPRVMIDTRVTGFAARDIAPGGLVTPQTMWIGTKGLWEALKHAMSLNYSVGKN